jgi:transposase-like protein
LNVLDKLLRRLHAQARARLHVIYEAPTRAECARRRAAYAQELRAQGQANAADCLERDAEDFLAFYDFPEEHWLHLRITNRSSPSSPGCGCAPTLPSERGSGRTPSTWSSSWSCG